MPAFTPAPEDIFDKEELLAAIGARLGHPTLTPAQRLDLQALAEAVAAYPRPYIPRERRFEGRRFQEASKHPWIAMGVPFVQIREEHSSPAPHRLTVRMIFEPLGGFAPDEPRPPPPGDFRLN